MSKTTEIVVQQTIDIPRIAVVPTGEVTTGFHPFKLGSLPNFQPGNGRSSARACTNHQFTMSREGASGSSARRTTSSTKLVDFDDIDYFTQADLLYDLWPGRPDGALPGAELPSSEDRGHQVRS